MWKLIKTEHTDWYQDRSGLYTLINWIDDNTVRLDVMRDTDNMPIISWQGKADDVRKYSARHFENKWPFFSCEHAAYIGAELARCELLKKDYVQD